MKLPVTSYKLPVASAIGAAGKTCNLQPSTRNPRRGFTLVEIAICLGIIGVALVAIIGILPAGLHTQRDSREETIVGQDASVIFEAVRNGSRGMDDLTNYVYLISNSVTAFDSSGAPGVTTIYGYTYTGSTINGASAGNYPITNCLRIIGLLSTPEFHDASFKQITNVFSGGFSNHVVAYVRALSGVASERPPQDNPILRDDSFAYRLYCVNAPMSMTDANSFYQNVRHNLHELRVTFLWPLLPNGGTGKGRQTLRASIAGLLVPTNEPTASQTIYFYQPGIFTAAP
jgi:prepilin-type N-terminal cleavage/methylation domain-containing protein